VPSLLNKRCIYVKMEVLRVTAALPETALQYCALQLLWDGAQQLHLHSMKLLFVGACVISTYISANAFAPIISCSAFKKSSSLVLSSSSSSSSEDNEVSKDTKLTADSMFDRTAESAEMAAMLNRKPIAVRLLLGPRSSGKTRLLKHCLCQSKLNQSICCVDCRSFDASAPTTFARGLEQRALPLFLQTVPSQVVYTIEKLLETPLIKGGVSAVKSLTMNSEDSSVATFTPIKLLEALLARTPVTDSPMQRICDAFDVLVSTWTAARTAGTLGPDEPQYPVLIIDEVNIMMRWNETNHNDLQYFSNYVVRVGKQDNSCHVVLATSDYGATSG
jgi:ATPase domain predominantly from Archaea